MSYRFAQVEIDTARQVVRVAGREVPCQTRVYQLLLLLCEARGAVVPRETIFARLWEGQLAPSDESLTQVVHRLRSTLGPGSQVVHTVRGVGFRLDSAVEVVGDRHARPGDGSEQGREAGVVGGGEPAAPAGARRTSGASRWRAWLPPLLALGVAAAWSSLPKPWQVIESGFALERGDVDAEHRQTIDLVSRAFAAERIGDRGQAKRLLETAHATDAATPVPAAFLCIWSPWQERTGDGERWAKAAAARLRPASSPYLHLLVQYAAATTGDRDRDWLAASSALLALRPSAWSPRLARAHYHLARREAAAALADLQKISVPSLSDPNLSIVLADRASLGDVAGAERAFASERRPGQEALACYVRGRIAWSKRRVGEARQAFDRELVVAIRQNQPDLAADARLLGGLAACEEGDLAAAASRFDRAALDARDEHRPGAAIEALGLGAWLAWRRADLAGRDRRLGEAAALHAKPEWPNDAALTLLALWTGARPPREPRALAAAMGQAPEVAGVDELLLARQAFTAGDREQARRGLRRAWDSGVGKTYFMEEAALLAADLGEPPTPQWVDPPYPNLLRFAAAEELDRRLMRR
jgi:DNA-binding winged helix-turn-helix (wHTH) protein/tetratricopeptide (TPR) repeat protein